MAAAAAVMAVAAPTFASAATRTVTVFGHGTVKVPNDIALLHFRVATRARDASTALDRDSARTRRMLAAIEAQGVRSRDIQTEEVSLSRHHTGPKHDRHVVYAAANEVNVTVRRVRTAGDVIDAAVHNGATSFDGGEFSTSKKQQLRLRALGAAFDDAKARASELARHADSTLGEALTIDEGALEVGGGAPFPASGTARGVPIQPGVAKVTADVTVTFALR